MCVLVQAAVPDTVDWAAKTTNSSRGSGGWEVQGQGAGRLDV